MKTRRTSMFAALSFVNICGFVPRISAKSLFDAIFLYDSWYDTYRCFGFGKKNKRIERVGYNPLSNAQQPPLLDHTKLS